MTTDIPTAAVVLDFGCGNGSFIAGFQQKGWELHGFDFSTTGIGYARAAYPSVRFYVGNVAEETFEHPLIGQCDLVISTEVIEHVFLPRFFARNCFSLLKPGGRLIVSTPYHGYVKNLALALAGELDHHFHALWDYGHIKFWSRRSLSTLLIEAGFRIDEFAGSGRAPYMWKSMVLSCSRPHC